ncbi:MAG: hypothetical protein JWQ63_1521 [Mucilaginibacter sp.]|nr:hypothetical protein [Mucilaginibacter sp.]
MKPFNIPFLVFAGDSLTIEQVSLALDQKEQHLIAFAPWPAFSYNPIVAFSIAHGGNNIFLKYYVEESAVTAIYRKTNGPVYKDSCVEFFIDFNDGNGYYNIEFNCAGTCHIGFGKEKKDRLEVPKDIIERIKYQALFKTGSPSPAFNIKWELSLIIPVDVFYYHKLNSLKNKLCHINFYKCGDDLPKPHYLSWADISYIVPNFHLPEFFVKAQFMNQEDISLPKDKYIEESF